MSEKVYGNRTLEVIHSPGATFLKNRRATGLWITSHRYEPFRLMADQKIFGSRPCPNVFDRNGDALKLFNWQRAVWHDNRGTMPRSARLDAPGVLHYIIIRGIERRNILIP